MSFRTLWQRLLRTGLCSFAHLRSRRLERGDVAEVQRRTLLRLVRHARTTRFGREHDFAHVRTIAGYQQRVPLRTYENFWSGYWQKSFPVLDGITWPGRLPYLALSSGTTTGTTKYIPVSREMLASNQKAGLTTLALFLAAYPRTPLFAGRFFFLGGSTDLRPLTPMGPRAGDLSGIAAHETAAFLRPFTFPPPELALLGDWERKLTLLAETGAALPISMVGGVPSWLLALFDRLRQVTGRQRIAEVWPGLRLVVHGGTRFEPYRRLFEQEIGDPQVRFQETYPASEGFVAAEDPRHGLLRLLPDHGIFFEFVPSAELGQPRPTRHTVADLETGVQYAVVLTTCAGLWSYVLGDTVCFERRRPPLLRFTGRTSQYLSAFGEHLIGEEVEHAVARAAERCGQSVVDFHVGPIFPTGLERVGRHRYLVELRTGTIEPGRFAATVDAILQERNEDYAAHRRDDVTLAAPEVLVVARGGFAEWMRRCGRLGGQHKVPRLDNSGGTTNQMSAFFTARHLLRGNVVEQRPEKV